MIGFPVYNNTPQMWKKRENEQMKGGHAMTVIGYNQEGFIIRNSWGDTWGLNGYCVYPYRDWGSHWEIWTTIDDVSEVLKPVREEEEGEGVVPIPPMPPKVVETDKEDYNSEDDYVQPTVCPNCRIF